MKVQYAPFVTSSMGVLTHRVHAIETVQPIAAPECVVVLAWCGATLGLGRAPRLTFAHTAEHVCARCETAATEAGLPPTGAPLAAAPLRAVEVPA